ncbi:MAG: acyl-CoA desaturase [Bacteroidetes bacterium]|nr:acyl-CoA desaturase [Bacteroidota bacterium]
MTMYTKTIAMLAMYFVPYFLIVAGIGNISLVIFYLLWIVMGFGITGIGTSVMHDSNHEAYSNNSFINNVLGGVLNILGGYSRNWKIQHNILHHTYTNLEGLDEDIEAGILLRMSPHKKKLGIHKFQHIYAWLLYGIMNIYWVTVKDYKCLLQYGKNGLLKKQKISLRYALTELTLYKIFYFGYTIVVPIFIAGVAWYHVVLGFIAMHLVAGLLLACIFQLAHVMETSEFPELPEQSKMQNNWAVHQVLNTANFAPDSKIMSWFIGGLNYQIEHHLFPHICHVHYPKLSQIVKQTAVEYNIPYNVQPTFMRALKEHARMLKKLGNN